MNQPPGILLTCEHASPAVPPGYQEFFRGATEVLESHRAYDPGALEVAEALSRNLDCGPTLAGEFTRLLIDLNRSLHHPRVFSEFSPPPGHPLREPLILAYRHFRQRAQASLQALLQAHQTAIHFSVHSFTPVLDGQVRNAELGLLYDPSRPAERELARQMAEAYRQAERSLPVRFNYPYRGVADGHTTTLRRSLGDRYVGIEIELNHGSFFADKAKWDSLCEATVQAVQRVAPQFKWSGAC
jgi:predicted N-formylglutamate amidohydrolase